MLKETLGSLLNEKELACLSSAFDVIGDIAIIKIPDELLDKKELIAAQILKSMKNVRTVLRQVSDVRGEYRIRDLSFVAGEEKYETIYKESGCLFKVNVKDVYFSPRLSTERERIAELVKDGELILNMFAGIGTFSIIIAKKKKCLVESVDLNPNAIELAKESLKLNKHLRGIINPILMDAGKYAALNSDAFDRVLMPLPERAKDFLPPAVEAARVGGTIHYYTHVPLHDFKDKSVIESELSKVKLSKKLQLISWRKVREVGPRYIQAIADLQVYS
jgi:tRNA (guanine37-N1)-methyltransferase